MLEDDGIGFHPDGGVKVSPAANVGAIVAMSVAADSVMVASSYLGVRAPAIRQR
jgi:hypothetical protein